MKKLLPYILATASLLGCQKEMPEDLKQASQKDFWLDNAAEMVKADTTGLVTNMLDIIKKNELVTVSSESERHTTAGLYTSDFHGAFVNQNKDTLLKVDYSQIFMAYDALHTHKTGEISFSRKTTSMSLSDSNVWRRSAYQQQDKVIKTSGQSMIRIKNTFH